jgi:flagellin-like protein
VTLGCKRKGVTPVIATILLIAGTVVLALVVGAYTFGLFGSNVKTIQLNSATLFGGPLPTSLTCSPTNSAYIALAINDPGATTNISGITLTGSSLTTTVSSYYLKSGTCTLISSQNQPGISGGSITSIGIYFGGSSPSSMKTGQVINYVINFANGQSVAGSLLAQ